MGKQQRRGIFSQLSRALWQAPARAARSLQLEPLEARQLLAVGPQLVSVTPNNGDALTAGTIRKIAPQELLFRFNEREVIDAATLGGITVTRANSDNVIGNGNDIAIAPGSISIGDSPNEVILRFATALPNDLYRVTIVGAGANALKNTAGDAFNGGVNRSIDFKLDLGAQVVSVVPQPVTRAANGQLSQARDQIVVYFSNDDLYATAVKTGAVTPNPTVVDPKFYQLIFTADSVTNTDDQIVLPTSVSYDPASDSAVLTFASDLALLAPGAGTYRLRIGNDAALPAAPTTINVSAANDPGSSFATADNLGLLTSQSKIIQSAIEPQNFPLDFPGTTQEPGHRDISEENHYLTQPDSVDGIEVYYYNFKSYYGNDPRGNPLTNVITPAQKELARKIFSLYSQYLGVQFIESDTRGLTVVTGDMRAIDPAIVVGPGGIISSSSFDTGLTIMDNAESWEDSFGGNWFQAAFEGIGYLLGLGQAYELPALTIMAEDLVPGNGVAGEPIFPGQQDIIHGQYLHRPEGNDIDLYSFTLDRDGVFSAETFAERMANNASLLDTTISLWRRVGNNYELLSRNDDYFSEDSFLQMPLTAGEYVIGIAASGDRQFDPTVANTGLYGTSDGPYQLRLNFTPAQSSTITDIGGTALDGDHDGTPGGAYNFWFRAQTLANTKFVDKSALGGATADGSLAKPYRTLTEAFAAVKSGQIVRVVANGGSDNNVATVNNNLGFLVGVDAQQRPLEDGATVKVPQGVTLMIDAGVVFKSLKGAIEAGSSAPGVDRSGSVVQVLGTPTLPVYFTSYNDESIGRDTQPTVAQTPHAGDWGGIIFRDDLDRANPGRLDYEARGIFLNYVNNADLRYGGGSVTIDSRQQVVTPINIVDARPTITFNKITLSADAAVSASPDSFEETNYNAPRYQNVAFTLDYARVGPEIHGNTLTSNTLNALYIRIRTPAGDALRPMTVAGRFDDTDIVHVLTENLVIQGTAGGPKYDELTNTVVARPDASLVIDPGVVVKLSNAAIQVDIGAQLIAEGSASNPVVFTSIKDDTVGAASGTFDTASDGAGTKAAAGDWGGIYFGQTASGSVADALFRYGGGVAKLREQFAGFNVIEVQQADVRVVNSIFELSGNGTGGTAPSDRFGLLGNAEGTIFVRGAQPIIAGNILRNNAGAAININASALSATVNPDWGRARGAIERIEEYDDNYGPLVADNRLGNNGINGMVVRGGDLLAECVWDDTSIVHVVQDLITVPDFHSSGGLRLQSDANRSLVVKLAGPQAGFEANGKPLDIDDRIGGSLRIIGQPGAPVILTSLKDDTAVGGLDLNGAPFGDTNNDGAASVPAPGDWRSVRISEYANDRNVATYVERELSNVSEGGTNASPDKAEFLGALATSEKGGDDNLRLGYTITGALASPSDVDVYSFQATAGTEVWLDIDRTSQALDTVVELIDSDGNVVARSDNSYDEGKNPSLLVGSALPMQKLPTFGGDDFFGVNPKDAGMRVVLPEAVGTNNTYHVRVRSSSGDLTSLSGGLTSGVYQLQIRLRETDEIAGSTVHMADIRYATNGIEVFGQPAHSPLLGEASEDTTANDSDATAQDLGNVLQSDRGAVSVAGNLDASGTDVDFYRFEVKYEDVLDQGAAQPRYAGVTFDVDYADGLSRPDTVLSIFDAKGNLILTANDSQLFDDQTAAGSGSADLSRGSFGPLDAFLGTVELEEGTYYVAVTARSQMAQEIEQFVERNPTNPGVRLEPIDSVVRIAEDHFDYSGGSTAANPVVPVLVDQSTVKPFNLSDVTLFVSYDTNGKADQSRLVYVNPFTGHVDYECKDPYNFDVGDLAFHDDARQGGSLQAFSLDVEDANGPSDGESGNLLEFDLGTGAATNLGDDGLVTNGVGQATTNVGVQFEAMTIVGNGDAAKMYAIGYRGDYPGGVAPIEKNILYRFDADGNVLDIPPNAGNRLTGAATNAIERGEMLMAIDPANEIVTGMAIVGDVMYCVSDLGGLYRIDNYATPGATATYIDTSAADLKGIQFAGLSAGPNYTNSADNTPLENGMYSGMLFGISEDGTLYAFDTRGVLQPVFANGQTSVETGLNSVQGLAFSSYQESLWHVTGRRNTDDGHGITRPYDRSRVASATGGASFYFGRDYQGPDLADYDTAGGSHGTIISNPFDLSEYNKSDCPVLYFNYMALTQEANYAPGANTPMLDSFRVYITEGDTGQWHLLATNDTYKSLGNLDEYDDPNLNDNIDVDVQELFDYTAAPASGWRQARVLLSDFAGMSDLRLRFEFDSSGSSGLGDPETTGSELRAVPGSAIRDGNTFTIDRDYDLSTTDDQVTFEFDSNVTLVVPSGAQLHDGDRVTINTEQGTKVFEFDNNGKTSGGIAVSFLASESAAVIAERFATAALSAGLAPHLNGGRINLEDALSVTVAGSSPALLVEGGVGRQNGGDAIVRFNEAMTSTEVAQAITQGMAAYLAYNKQIVMPDAVPLAGSSVTLSDGIHSVTVNLDASYNGLSAAVGAGKLGNALMTAAASAGLNVTFFVSDRRINVFGDTVDLTASTQEIEINDAPVDAFKRFNDIVSVHQALVADRGPLLLADSLWGDTFGTGEYYVNGEAQTSYSVAQQMRQAQNNDLEGIFIDDLVIGFAGRGEMVTNATPNTTFRDDPEMPLYTSISGLYQLEVRRGMEYGTPIPYQVGPAANSITLLLDRSVNVNERLSQGVTLLAPEGANLVDGQSFTLGDGLDQYAFSFKRDGDTLANAISTGITGGVSKSFFAGGAIGDSYDVDFYSFDVKAGDRVTIDIDANINGSSLFAALQVFDATGVPQPVVYSNAPGEPASLDPYITFTATKAGRYYVGVSDFSNVAYDPTVAASGTPSATLGSYQIDIQADGGAANPTLVIPFDGDDSAANIAKNILTAINQPALKTLLDVTAASLPNAERVELFGSIALVTGFTGYLRELNDTLADAVESGIQPNGNGAFHAYSFIGDNNAGPDRTTDVDTIKLQLKAGQTIAVDIDTQPENSSLDAYLEVLDAAGNVLDYNFDGAAPGEAVGADPYLEFTAPADGTYFVRVGGSLKPIVVGATYQRGTGYEGQYEISITRNGAPLPQAIGALVHTDYGDTNIVREQGQLLIDGNRITNSLGYGIEVDAGRRDETPDSPMAHPGATRNLSNVNLERLAPGVTITNNVVAFNGDPTIGGANGGGIHFSGDANTAAGGQLAPIPFGRILNNTIYGLGGADTGILIDQNASPTVLNNIVANAGLGVSIDATSQSTVLGGMLFQNNLADSNAGLGNHAIVLAANDPLFVNPAAGNFYLEAGSLAIDSSVKSLEDRRALTQVRQPIGYENSPVLAPEWDALGQLRADDPNVNTPSGLGETVFIDRGAIDRVDFDAPRAYLAVPADGDEDGQATTNPRFDFVIQLVDSGAGIDDASVTSGKVVLTFNGVPLVDGVDYIFHYDVVTDQITLSVAGGTDRFAEGSYRVTLDNSAVGIVDAAQNPLAGNQVNGALIFTITVGQAIDYGDAPAPYPTLKANNGAGHLIVDGFHLGDQVDADPDGKPSANADADAFDDGVTFNTPIRPAGQGSITVRASAAGRLDAWIDYNRDGIWEANEKIFDSVPLLAGSNSLVYSPQAGVVVSSGVSFARFRFSSVGGLGPTGLANDGEVEDYKVVIQTAPWQNPTNALDVNNDGYVTTLDALIVANFLYLHGGQALPEPGTAQPPLPASPPPYYDVNGDSYLTAADALTVVDYLRNRPKAMQAMAETSAAEQTPQASFAAASIAPLAPALTPSTAETSGVASASAATNNATAGTVTAPTTVAAATSASLLTTQSVSTLVTPTFVDSAIAAIPVAQSSVPTTFVSVAPGLTSAPVATESPADAALMASPLSASRVDSVLGGASSESGGEDDSAAAMALGKAIESQPGLLDEIFAEFDAKDEDALASPLSLL